MSTNKTTRTSWHILLPTCVCECVGTGEERGHVRTCTCTHPPGPPGCLCFFSLNKVVKVFNFNVKHEQNEAGTSTNQACSLPVQGLRQLGCLGPARCGQHPGIEDPGQALRGHCRTARGKIFECTRHLRCHAAATWKSRLAVGASLASAARNGDIIAEPGFPANLLPWEIVCLKSVCQGRFTDAKESPLMPTCLFEQPAVCCK